MDRRTIKAIKVAAASQPMHWPDFKATLLGMKVPRDKIKQRITARLQYRLKNGMIEEVETLRQNGVSWDTLHFLGLEYRFIAQYLQGTLTYNDFYQKLNSAIHYFAKQQEKWFRKMERKGHVIHWLDTESTQPVFDQASAIVKQMMSS